MVNVEELLHDMHSSTLNFDAADNDNMAFGLPMKTRDQLQGLKDRLNQDEMLQQKLVNLVYLQCFVIHVLSDALNVDFISSVHMQIVLPYAKIK